MKRDFSGQILDLKDKPMMVGMTPESMLAAIEAAAAEMGPEASEVLKKHLGASFNEPITFAAACADALVSPQKGEESQPIGERSKRFALAMKIAGGKQIDITPEERESIKVAVNGYFRGAIIPGRIDGFLEGK